jgi:hypothetical protein
MWGEGDSLYTEQGLEPGSAQQVLMRAGEAYRCGILMKCDVKLLVLEHSDSYICPAQQPVQCGSPYHRFYSAPTNQAKVPGRIAGGVKILFCAATFPLGGDLLCLRYSSKATSTSRSSFRDLHKICFTRTSRRAAGVVHGVGPFESSEIPRRLVLMRQLCEPRSPH